VEAVSKRYGHVEALRDVSLDFAAGKLTAILGPSGCGKTTLLRAIAGFVTVDGGAVRFDGDAVTSLPPQQRGTAMVFQSYALWPRRSSATSSTSWSDSFAPTSPRRHRCHGIWVDGALPGPLGPPPWRIMTA
jgi:ABC-type multidrug transport system ATPase subunit